MTKDPPATSREFREHIVAGIAQLEQRIAEGEQWLAVAEQDPEFHLICAHVRALLIRDRARLDKERLELDAFDKAERLPRHVQVRLHGRRLHEIGADPDFHRLVERFDRVSAVTERSPRRRESHRNRPGHRRASSSSTSSGNDPGSDGDSEPPRLALVAKPGAFYRFAVLTPAERGEACEVCCLDGVEVNVSEAAGKRWTCLACHLEKAA